MSDALKRIPLDRRVLVVRENRIDLRPERGAVLFPLVGLTIALVLFAIVASLSSSLSANVLAIILLPGLLLAPFSAMGLVYSVIGASVVVERKKSSIRFQQGVLGLGIGTMELVPFWKIEHLAVEDFPLGDITPGGPPPILDLRAWDIVLVKKSGKRLSIGQVVAANTADLIDEGFGRALDAAEAIAAMAESTVVITAALDDGEPMRTAEAAAEPAKSQTEPAAG
ncbi:MAG: hypothetical protein ABI559_10420 [Chloroflexota bacterium]